MFESVVCEMAAILSRPQYVKDNGVWDVRGYHFSNCFQVATTSQHDLHVTEISLPLGRQCGSNWCILDELSIFSASYFVC